VVFWVLHQTLREGCEEGIVVGDSEVSYDDLGNAGLGDNMHIVRLKEGFCYESSEGMSSGGGAVVPEYSELRCGG